jgi:L-rhamnose-H+ transport protein
LTSLLLVPCTLGLIFVPGWPWVYAAVPFSALLPSLLFGFGWGIAQVLFGISVVRLGMALAFTIVVGLGTFFGTFIPFVAGHEGNGSSHASILLMAGCGLMLAGVTASGYAGRVREKSQSFGNSSYMAGLSIAVFSGLLSSMLNLSLAFGKPIALAGGLIPNLGYAIFLLNKNRSWKSFGGSGTDALWSLLMGLLWIGAVVIYGISTRFLGTLGDSAGWAIYQTTMVLTANAAGLVAGEWRRASPRASAALGTGIALLIVATITIAISTR